MEHQFSDADHHELLILSMAGTGHFEEAADDLLYKLERMRIVSERRLAELSNYQPNGT